MTPDLPVVALGLLPWVALALWLAVGVKAPRPLGDGTVGSGEDRGSPPSRAPWPLVSIIVPARNEAHNIERCVESLAALDYPDFEILVVDDRSQDGTGALARAVPPGNARALRVIAGEPLPAGWFGKPWACHTGSLHGKGRFLLFTDADTTHQPQLLRKALSALREDEAGALSLIGRQEMGTFWERLVMPHFFLLIGMRFPRLDRPIDPDRWGDAIANGQYILVDREAYDAVGGHEAVRGEVVEDLRLAQELTRGGFRLTIRGAEDEFSTRMYTSLRELVEGWTKNLATGARQASGRLGAAAIPGMFAFTFFIWLLPPLTVALSIFVEIPSSLLLWGAGATALSMALWAGGYARMGASPAYGLLYFVGVGVGVFIAFRSVVRGERRIEWKGRRYGA